MATLGTDVDTAVAHLRAGELVALPTETVYGLAGNALDTAALAQIFAVKERPRFDPLIVHVAAPEQLTGLVADPPVAAQVLMEKFWPGPLTLVLPKTDLVPDLATSGLPNVAVRVPNHPLTLAVLRALAFPLAMPSANPFGYVSPTTAAHVAQQLGGKIPYILDGGPCAVGVESTVLSFVGNTPVVLRPGGVPVEALEKVIGPIESPPTGSAVGSGSPGQLPLHYSPHTPMEFIDPCKALAGYNKARVGILSYMRRFPNHPHQFQLAPTGALREAAQRLYTGLRYLDSLGLEVILAEPVPDTGLGRAINDRLRRASAKRHKFEPNT